MPTKHRYSHLFALALCLCALCGGGRAQDAKQPDAKDDPSVARMRKDITFLASDECEGRGVGTLGLDLAAQYIAVQFKQAGLKPGGVNGTYFQPFPFCTNAQLDGVSEITLIRKDGENRVLKQGDDFQVLGTSAPAALTASVVFVGYGVTAKGIEYDDYAGVDVKGKIVIALKKLPRWNDKENPFDGASKADLAPLESKQYRGQLAKAAAVILVNDASETKDALMPFSALARGIMTVSIPYVQMKREVLDDLLKASTGKTLAETEKAIDADLKPQSAVLKDVQMTMNVKVKRQETMVKNVIGYLDGSGPLADETVVVGAHYDHLGYGFGFGSMGGKDAKGKIHHGADDNGSGSTTVIELARRFGAMKNREGRRMVFMTFTAEERGLIGSRHYCKVEPLFPLKNTVAMVNLDMVGRVNPRITRMDEKTVTVADEDGKEVRTYDLSQNCEFYRQVKGAKKKFTDGLQADEYKKMLARGLSASVITDAKNQVTRITLTGEPTLFGLGMETSADFENLVKKHNPGFEILPDKSVFGQSDHFSFYQQKIPVLFFFTGLHPDYHRPSDTSDKINVAGMKRVADMSERILDELRTDPKRPDFSPIKSNFTPGGTGGVRIGFTPDMGYNGKGVRVDAVSAKGPAEQAGIKTGDIIIELAGKETPNLIAYQKIRESLKGGVAVEIKVLRDSKELTFKVTPAASK